MTKTQTRSCDQCRHFDCNLWVVGSVALPCAKGHSPRFYKPRADQQHLQGGGAWGWRRRCDDYEAKKT
jgi:hypothetical protein